MPHITGRNQQSLALTGETHTGALQETQCDPRISGVGSDENGSLAMYASSSEL